ASEPADTAASSAVTARREAIRINVPRSLLATAGFQAATTRSTTCTCGRRRLHIDARRRERAGLELPTLRRLHILVVIAPAQRDASGIAVFTDVDDHRVLTADRAAGSRLDDVIGDEVTNVVGATRLRVGERREVVASF